MRISVNDYAELRRNYDELKQFRFYPDAFPVMDHEPLKHYFQLLSSPEEIGKAIITLITFQKDDLVAQCSGIMLPFQTLHSLQHEETLFFHDDWYAGFLLHSCEPNCKLDMNDFTLHAVRDIKVYELLTVDYNATEKKLYQGFNCLCGSANCKGWIGGYDYKEN